MTTTERPTLPTLAEVRAERPPFRVDLDKLPVDPDGWCSFEVTAGGWSHTPMCSHGVANGGPRLCEMWREKDARDAAKRRRPFAYELAQIDAYEASHTWPYSGGRDAELEGRRNAAWRGMGDEDRIFGKGGAL